MAGFMLRSDAFSDGGALPTEFTCDGDDRSPPLSWSEPPQGTKSFALVVDDPDAPSSTFRHRAAFNISASAHSLGGGAGNQSEGIMAQPKNDSGKQGYGGACPPMGHGTHHYRFKLFALNTEKLNLPPEASIEQVGAAASKYQLASAGLMGTYERK